ncbi:3-oxo-tetronate kinase [Georgenia sp. Z1491]|uniref:3-oxo-tetronate kinase n=1 Tax=Georgenia sp. Z1491 TaxID=3416707 RepID=UPI003CF57C2E
MTRDERTVALISATPVAIPPATDALAEALPDATVWNLLDDRLLADAADAGELTEPLRERMVRLIAHAVDGGADAVLLTCSMYGTVAEGTVADIPVLAPDGPAFEEAATGGYGTVLVVASLESALADSVQRFTEAVSDAGTEVDVRGLAVPAALAAAKADDPSALATVLIDACRPFVDGEAGVDAVLLAQYSLSPAQAQLAEALGVTVISGPSSAAATLRDALAGLSASGLSADEPGARSADARGGPAEDRLDTRSTDAPLGAIADDYTGGTDLALAWRRAGLRTLLFFGPPPRNIDLPEHDAIVVALKSRTAPVFEAVEESLRAGEWLRAQGARQLYLKYCSTFDSTPQGNIGPVLDALADAVGAGVVVTTPSSPEHARTVYAGQLFVDDVLLAETHMANHPLTPMTDSYLPRVLQAQSGRSVGTLPLATIRQGTPAVRAAITEPAGGGSRHVLADAVEAHDLRVLAESVADQPLVAGAAGLGGAMAELRTAATSSDEATAPDPVGDGRAAVLAGSCSARTLAQIADLQRRGHPTYRVDALTADDPAVLADGALAWADALPDGPAPLIYTSLPADELREVQSRLGTAESAALLEGALSRIAVGLVDRGVRRLVSAGGETSGAIVHALEVAGAAVGGEVSTGVPWIYAIGAEPLALLLKSGNFGDVAMFSRAVDVDQGWGTHE